MLRVAAHDRRAAAAVAQGLHRRPRLGPGHLPVSTARLLPAVVRDLARAARGAEPVTVPAAGPPRSAALMTAPDCEAGYAALHAQAPTERGDVAARFVPQLLRYRPGRSARAVRCPLLAVVCRTDSVAPAAATLRHLRAAPRLELLQRDDGHFDIYAGSAFEELVTPQTAFLVRHLARGDRPDRR